MGAIPACDSPSGVTVNSVLSNSANVSWAASPTSGATYQIEYGPTGFTQGTGTVITSSTTSATIPNLTPSTGYQFYVRSNCGANGFSAWTAVKSLQQPVLRFHHSLIRKTLIQQRSLHAGRMKPFQEGNCDMELRNSKRKQFNNT